MESSRDAGHSVYYHIPGTAVLNPSYDGSISGPISKKLAKASKWIASKGQPTLFTTGTDIELINFDDPRLEKNVCKNFHWIYGKVTKSNKDRFYVQTPGDLGQTAWKKVALVMKKDIQRRLDAGEKPLKVYLTTHSHGGQIARYLAEEFKDNPDVEFYVNSIEMPNCIYPPLLMPKNVKVWLQSACPGSFFREFGSCIMQSENLMGDQTVVSPIFFFALAATLYQWFNGMYTHKVEEVHRERQANWFPTAEAMSAFWKTFELDPAKFWDKHNGPVLDPTCAKDISENFLDLCVRYQQSVTSQLRPG